MLTEEEIRLLQMRPDDLQNSEAGQILDFIQKDNLTVTWETGRVALESVEELDRNWESYENTDLFHGTTSLDLPEIVSKGLQPGEHVESNGGEFGTCGQVSLTPHLPLAVEYAYNGTPDLGRAQARIDETYEHLNLEAPDLSTEEGREKFKEDVSEKGVGWRSYLEGLSSRVEVLGEDYDPIVLGVEKSGLDIEFSTSDLLRFAYQNNLREEYEDEQELVSDIEVAEFVEWKMPEVNEVVYEENKNGVGEITANSVPPEAIRAFVPHQSLEKYREEFSGEIEILDLESLKLKRFYDFHDTYEDKRLSYSLPWSESEKYDFTLETEVVERNGSITARSIRAV